MLITISILMLVYLISGKDVKPLLEKIKWINLKKKIKSLLDKIRPWALKAGRAATRPILQFYYVMDDDNTSTVDRVMIYGAIVYTIIPFDLLPRAIFGSLGLLDDVAAMLYVRNRIKERITPEITTRVEEQLDEWFGVEYEMVQ